MPQSELGETARLRAGFLMAMACYTPYQAIENLNTGMEGEPRAGRKRGLMCSPHFL
jgi:hypothetical protein